MLEYSCILSCHPLKVCLFRRSTVNKSAYSLCGFSICTRSAALSFHIFASYLSCYNEKIQCFNLSVGFFLPRDARGMTPFMSAVSGRAYPAAITILETAQKIAKGTTVLVIVSVWFPSKLQHVCKVVINTAYCCMLCKFCHYGVSSSLVVCILQQISMNIIAFVFFIVFLAFHCFINQWIKVLFFGSKNVSHGTTFLKLKKSDMIQ